MVQQSRMEDGYGADRLIRVYTASTDRGRGDSRPENLAILGAVDDLDDAVLLAIAQPTICCRERPQADGHPACAVLCDRLRLRQTHARHLRRCEGTARHLLIELARKGKRPEVQERIDRSIRPLESSVVGELAIARTIAHSIDSLFTEERGQSCSRELVRARAGLVQARANEDGS